MKTDFLALDTRAVKLYQEGIFTVNTLQSIVATVSLGTVGLFAFPNFFQITNAATSEAERFVLEAWGTLHTAIPAWDIQTSLVALNLLKGASDRCMASFATELEQALQSQGAEGFRQVNSIKLNLNENSQCNLSLVDYEFSPLTFPQLPPEMLPQASNSVGNSPSSMPRDMNTLWSQLHNAVTAWDVETAQQTLTDLRTQAATEIPQAQQCIAQFAERLEDRLNDRGVDGFREINRIKTELNENPNCNLPLVAFTFAPISEDSQASLEAGSPRNWNRLHEAVAVWDVITSQDVLSDMAWSTDECLNGFAATFQRELKASEKGFQQINVIKRRYNSNLDCYLPILTYSFAP